MLPRVLEPEVMDSRQEAEEYDVMDHTEVNQRFADDLRKAIGDDDAEYSILDVGVGTAWIPIACCRLMPKIQMVGVDLAGEMLNLGIRNIQAANVEERIQLRQLDAKTLPFEDRSFTGVISNSLIHHIPEPRIALHEMWRVLQVGGVWFVRDLIRPGTEAELNALVVRYAATGTAHQRELFDASLRAALTVDEVRALVQELGVSGDCVRQTSDRHWTLSVQK